MITGRQGWRRELLPCLLFCLLQPELQAQQAPGSPASTPVAPAATTSTPGATIPATTSVAGAIPKTSIPPTKTAALDGRKITLPNDLSAHATVLILGFGRKSAEPTTAWERAVRGSLVQAPEIAFFDMAMLAEVPGFARGWVMRLIRSKVPDALKPNFLAVTTDEAAWKQAAGYDNQQPDAPYVMLVDRNGAIRWATHELCTPEHFALMATKARDLVAEAR